MDALFWLAFALGLFAAWGLSPDKKPDGTPVTGKYPIAVDEHGRPTSPSLCGDTRRAP